MTITTPVNAPRQSEHRRREPERSASESPWQWFKALAGVRVHHSHGTTSTVELCGELDVYTGPWVRRILQAAIVRGSRALAVDLHRVEFIDGTGLRALLDAARAAEARGGSLVLLRPRPPAARLLRITASEHLVADAGWQSSAE
jgi:anti-anti-sigma factor